MTVVLYASPCGVGSRVVGGDGGGGGAAAVVAAAAALNHGCAGGSHGRRCRRRGDNGPVAVTPVVVGAGREHGVHRADTGA